MNEIDKTTAPAKQRMHSMALKGAEVPLPTKAGTHLLHGQNLVQEPGSATANPLPYSDEEQDAATQSADGRPFTPTEQELIQTVATAIAQLDKSNASLWHKNGAPKRAALEAALGFDINDNERDQAWALHNASQA